MSRSQQWRVNRLLKVAGPCPACVERQQQLLDQPRAQERVVKHWDQIKVQREDPSWLQEEAVRLAEEADRIERGPGHRDEFGWVPDPVPADEITKADDEPHRVVPIAAGCRRCVEDAKLLPTQHIDDLAARMTAHFRRQRSDPDWLRAEARDLQARADALLTAAEATPTPSTDE